MTLRTVLFCLLLALSGCGEEKQPSGLGENKTRDVQYFVEHPDELKRINEQCDNNPGALGMTPECENVSRAKRTLRSVEIQGK